MAIYLVGQNFAERSWGQWLTKEDAERGLAIAEERWPHSTYRIQEKEEPRG